MSVFTFSAVRPQNEHGPGRGGLALFRQRRLPPATSTIWCTR